MARPASKKPGKAPEEAPPGPRATALDEALAAAERDELAALVRLRPGCSVAEQLAAALAGAQAWRLRALWHERAGDADAARKASTTADEQASLAVKLERGQLVDRVERLEHLVRSQGRAGERLQALDRSRRGG